MLIYLSKTGWRPLMCCKPGTEFVTRFGIYGTLVSINECRARVKIDKGMKRVKFGNRNFIANSNSYQDWTPSVEVKVKRSQVKS